MQKLCVSKPTDRTFNKSLNRFFFQIPIKCCRIFDDRVNNLAEKRNLVEKNN